MNKRDRGSVRTAADLERKYDFKSFIEAAKNYKNILGRLEKLENGSGTGYDESVLEAKYQEGYTAGYEEGQANGLETGYNNGYTEGQTAGYSMGYTAGKTAGYNDGYNDGVDSVLNPFEYALAVESTYKNATFPDNYELTLDLPNVTSLASAFHGATGLKKLTVKGNTAGNSINFTYAFRCETVEIIDLSGFNVIFSISTYTFNGASALKEIKGMLDFSNCTAMNQTFGKCTALEEVRLKENSLSVSTSFAQSPLLSATSIQSIIDGLATVETAQTLTLHSDIVLTDEQKAIITSKGWTLAQ